MRTRVKMCGTTRMEDGLAAVQYGVDALGFILFPGSQRFVPPESAAVICDRLPPFVDKVGVVVDVSIKTAVEAVKVAGFSYLQLHGTESSNYCMELKYAVPHLKLIKAFRIGDQTRAEDFAPYEEWVDGFLLDTYQKGVRGGTGKMFDWSIVSELHLERPVILAGGLSSDNIANAISTVHPYAVDINSGIEIEPGIKDHVALKKIMNILSRHDK